MTREEAIDVLKRLVAYDSDLAEAKQVAIEALKSKTEGNLISRQAALAEFIDGRDVYDITESIEQLKDWLSALPSANAEWIPCSDRLPSKSGQYLVFYEGAVIGSHIDIMWYGEPLMPNVDVSGKHFYRDVEWRDIIYDEVVAWMPLPKPYKGGDSE